MAKKLITPAGIKFLYSINDIMLRISYMTELDLEMNQLSYLSNQNKVEFVKLTREIIQKRWLSLKNKHASIVPTYEEVACYCFGVNYKNSLYMSKKMNKTHYECIKIVTDAFDYFDGIYQSYSID
jgi:hypothetical protein